jgi:transcriptional regulator with XRE-family HTH domain
MEASVVTTVTPRYARDVDLKDWVKRERDRRGWTQQKLADEAGLDRVEVNALENGRNKGSTTRIRAGLAKAFGITIEEVGGAAPTTRVEYDRPPGIPAAALGNHRDWGTARAECEARYGRRIDDGVLDEVASMTLSKMPERLDGEIVYRFAEALMVARSRSIEASISTPEPAAEAPKRAGKKTKK